MDSRIKELTLQEKARLLCGYRNMGTYPIERLGIASLSFSDGPNGLRIEAGGDNISGISNSLKATVFPTGVNLASSWNKTLLHEVGSSIGKEGQYYHIDVLLGPAVNIKKDPRCGRNFEYYSEDPLLAGLMGASFVNGLQENKVAACVKHFACNNNEGYRFNGEAVVDERALHEIYLRPFELISKLAHPQAIMTAYNRVNGYHCSENEYLQNEILRKKWGFDGLSMTDWGGIKDRVAGLKAGTDLEMPGMIEHNVQSIVKAYEEGSLTMDVIDQSVERLLKLSQLTKKNLKENYSFNEGYQVSLKAALESAVLLKNNGLLPLKKNQKVHVVGGLFSHPRYQGSGSSLLNPAILKYHRDVFDENKVLYDYSLGYIANETKVNKELENKALEECKDSDLILFYAGQNDFIESEGYDRESVCLPENQLSLFHQLLTLKKKIIVVLFGGSFVELPFLNDVDAILYMGLPGESIGEATYQLLFGQVSPSGRLSETWPVSLNDVSFQDEFLKNPYWLYKESIFVGYRYYSSIHKKVNFPFGYGLSYADFKYIGYHIEQSEKEITIKVKLQNISQIKASEVIEIYTSKKDSSIYRPEQELKGFEKVSLLPNEIKEVSIVIPLEYLKVYDINHHDFVLEEGDYILSINKNVNEKLFSSTVTLKGEVLEKDHDNVKKFYHDLNNLSNMNKKDFEEIIGFKIPDYSFSKRPYTLETPIGEFKTLFGKIFAHTVINIGLKQYKKAKKMKDCPQKEREMKAGLFVAKMMPANTLRSLSFSAGKGFPYEVAVAVLDFCNNRFISGLKKIISMKKKK